MAETKILPCRCKHAYQDDVYGPNQRVCNQTSGGKNNPPGWRCTVCSATK